MADSINFEMQIKSYMNQISELQNVASQLHRENELLKTMFANECLNRRNLEKYNADYANECKELKAAIYSIQEELGAAYRKEELVKSLRRILSNIQF